jgi:hypothetical protein
MISDQFFKTELRFHNNIIKFGKDLYKISFTENKIDPPQKPHFFDQHSFLYKNIYILLLLFKNIYFSIYSSLLSKSGINGF